jgi:hypothetical protein
MNRYLLVFWLPWVLLALASCNRLEPEPVDVGHYLIDNQSDFTLRLGPAADVPGYLRSEVPPRSLVHFYSTEVGAGGSAAPQHTLTNMTVAAILPGGDSLIYQGTVFDDWEAARPPLTLTDSVGAEYTLTLPR